MLSRSRLCNIFPLSWTKNQNYLTICLLWWVPSSRHTASPAMAVIPILVPCPYPRSLIRSNRQKYNRNKNMQHHIGQIVRRGVFCCGCGKCFYFPWNMLFYFHHSFSLALPCRCSFPLQQQPNGVGRLKSVRRTCIYTMMLPPKNDSAKNGKIKTAWLVQRRLLAGTLPFWAAPPTDRPSPPRRMENINLFVKTEIKCEHWRKRQRQLRCSKA